MDFKPQKPTTVAGLRRLLADAPGDMPVVFDIGCTRSYDSPEVQTPRYLTEQIVGYNGNHQIPAVYETGEDADCEGQQMLVLSAVPFQEKSAAQGYSWTEQSFLEIDRSPLTETNALQEDH